MSARRYGEAEVAREARRIFRKLAAPGAHLAPCEDGYALFGSARARRHTLVVDPGLMGELQRRDWLKPRGTKPESWHLSAAGEGWYLRAQALTQPFAAQHQARVEKLIETGAGTRRVIVNEGESPLGWLRRRRLIDPAQFQAGERLRRDFTIAQLSPRLGVDLTAPIVLGRRGIRTESSLSEAVLEAKRRFRAAMAAAGPGLADTLFDVCCHLAGLEDVERDRNWPKRSARVVLQIALDRLAAHYGLAITARGHAPMRAWQADPAE